MVSGVVVCVESLRLCCGTSTPLVYDILIIVAVTIIFRYLIYTQIKKPNIPHSQFHICMFFFFSNQMTCTQNPIHMRIRLSRCNDFHWRRQLGRN